MATGDATRAALPNRIGDRYRVEKLLGTGGMASVYQVFDEVSRRPLALKRLQLPRESAAFPRRAAGHGAAQDEPADVAHTTQLFEREFDTLSQLVHPRIIEVYDYHRDALGPYYTMELLDGGDLRALSPLPWRQACALLCDVCSALSLLHSRRLAHRDLTPLNIRCTRSGSAKLFDFGSMIPFGRSRHVIGTPPFVAPESLHGEVVDAQTDLFALGATAYYALTGRHAYPARQLRALPDMWLQAPPAPASHYTPDIPPALDELVARLLQLAPSARPPSAADVMERLSAVGGFDLHEDLVVRQAYLSTPSLVGRDRALECMRLRLRSAAELDGGTIVVSAAPGGGRTRVLDACVLEARLLGAIVLRSDERDGGSRWGVARALLRQLLEQAPESAQPAVQRRAPGLVQILPELAETSVAEVSGTSESAFRARVQTALRDVFFEVAAAQLLIVVVDDVHRIDEPSSAVLARLAHDARGRRLLLIASTLPDDRSTAATAMQWLVHSGESIRLKPLSAEETEQLVRSLFGETPNVRLVADRIHRTSQGNPGAIMQIARQLVASGRAHYAAGTWTLPGQAEVADLSLALHTRVDPRLRSSALELARSFAACEGQRLTWNECLLLTPHGDARRLIGDIDELIAAGILSFHAELYFVSGAGMCAALLHDLDRNQARALHARVAEFHQRRGGHAFRIALHHWCADQSESAIDLLLADLRATQLARHQDPIELFEYVQSLPTGWQAMLRGLIALCPALGRSCRDRLDLQLALIGFTTVTAGYEPDCLQQVVAQLQHDCGLDLHAALSDSSPAQERLTQALSATQARFANLPEAERGLPLEKAIPTLAQVLVQAIGMAGRALDYGLLASMPSLVPLVPLSAALSLVQQNLESTRFLLAGRALRGLACNQRILEQIAQSKRVEGMSDTNLNFMTLAIHWSSALVESYRGDPMALTRAEHIEPSPLFEVQAWRIRAAFALFQGDLQAAERCRVQTELLQIQNSPAQLFEGSLNCMMLLGYFAAHDLLRTKQCIDELEAMARQFDPWKPIVLFARGAYQTLRGDGARALPEFERALGMLRLGHHIAWAACAGGVLEALNQQGRWDDSATRGYDLVDQMQREDLTDNVHFVTLPIAQAEIERGGYSAAASLLATVIEVLEGPKRRSVYLGRAYELRAWLALRMRDAREFPRVYALCRQQYAPSRNPILHGKLEQLQRAAGEADWLPDPIETRAGDAEDTAVDGSTIATSRCSSEETQERVERALTLLTRHSRCKGGFLYTLRRDGPALVAQRGEREPLPQLDELVTRFVSDHSSPFEVTLSQYLTTSTTPEQASWTAPDGTQFVPMLLAHRGELGPCITGVAVMWSRPDASYRVPTRLLTALSRTLQEGGDD